MNAKAIIIDKQQWYYLTHSWESERIHNFHKGIRLKVDLITRLDFVHAYYNVSVHYFSHYATRTTGFSFFFFFFLSPFFFFLLCWWDRKYTDYTQCSGIRPLKSVSWVGQSTASGVEPPVLNIWGVWSAASLSLLTSSHCLRILIAVRVPPIS